MREIIDFASESGWGAWLLATLLLFAMGCSKKPTTEAERESANAGVETMTVRAEPTTDSLEVSAHVMADPSKTVRIYPPLSGRVFGLRVLPGQAVKRGDVIAMLQSAEVAAARSDFEKAKIEVLRADRALARGKLLLDHEVLSQADYGELQAIDQVAHSEEERARQRIHELGFSENGVSDEIAVRSPIAGVVLDIGTATGELQRSLDNATTIATIANLDSVWVSGDVFERDLAHLQTGKPVQVLVPAYPDMRLTGTIANVGDAVDPNTHTLKLRVVLANPQHRLKPDLFATIRVTEGTRTAFTVPATAVLHDGEKTYVFVADAGGHYQQRTVQVGRSFDRNSAHLVEITDGLRDGERVVTVGGELLRSGEEATT